MELCENQTFDRQQSFKSYQYKMRAIIIFASLAVCANAAHLGYNYQSPSTQISQGGYSGGYGNAGATIGGNFGAGQSHGSSIGPFTGGDSHSSNIGGFNGFNGGVSHGPSIGGYNGGVSQGNVGGHINTGSSASDYQKEFFSFSAPEHEFEDDYSTEDLTSALKKNLRVIFIKGPENSGLENAALQLAKSSADQQTAIYVLTKQADLSALAHKLRNENTQSSNKPEVHFVKYRTPEEAEQAKHAIQSQYENLPGSTSSHDGGVAPVHNYVSAPQKTPSSTPVISSNAYLPANHRV